MKVLNRKGFTLTELLVVMGIVVVLASVSLPTFGRYLETSRETSDIEVVRTYYDECLSLAILDATDGAIDGKIAGTAASNANDVSFTTESAGIKYDSGAYVVTAANAKPIVKFKQTLSGWQYVSPEIAGVKAPDITTKTLTLSYTFELTTATGIVNVTNIAATSGT